MILGQTRMAGPLEITETTRYVKRIVLFRDTYDRLEGGRV